MAFGFFKDKSKGPLVVTCPLCEHTQQESPLAVSSYCKGCKAYLSFRKDGEVVARAQTSSDPFGDDSPPPKINIDHGASEDKSPSTPPPTPPAAKTTPPKKPDSKPTPTPKAEPKPKPAPQPAPKQIPPVAKEAPKKTEVPAEKKETESPKAQIAEQKVKTEAKAEPQKLESSPQEEPEEKELTPRYHRQSSEEEDQSKRAQKKKEANERLVACFECGDSHIANSRANSTQCRKCGRLISMVDQHIKEAWSSKIQTRGNVHIHRKGVVLGASIQCHNLIVEGDFTGSAECAGDLTLRRNGKIVGNVVCDRLLVEKRAKVEFLNVVEMNECKIDGLVTGDISCRGRLALEKKATLTGNIKVGSLTVADGAKHTGQIQMGSF